jgi:hypothetical protein
MMKQMQAVDLNHRIYDSPFRPFRIHLSDGSTIPVTNAGMVLVGESSVILPVEVGHDTEGYPLVRRWRTVALAHMVQFSDIDEPVSGTRPKKRG